MPIFDVCSFLKVAMTQTAVFQLGNRQAVRLPKDFRFNTKTGELFRRGREVVSRSMGDLIRHFPNLGDDFPNDIPAFPPKPLPTWDDAKGHATHSAPISGCIL